MIVIGFTVVGVFLLAPFLQLQYMAFMVFCSSSSCAVVDIGGIIGTRSAAIVAVTNVAAFCWSNCCCSTMRALS
jgi:hypothetical protein